MSLRFILDAACGREGHPHTPARLVWTLGWTMGTATVRPGNMPQPKDRIQSYEYSQDPTFVKCLRNSCAVS